MTPEDKKTTEIAIEVGLIIGFFFFVLDQFMSAMGPRKYLLISFLSFMLFLWIKLSKKSDEEVKQDSEDIGDKKSNVENEENLSNKSEPV